MGANAFLGKREHQFHADVKRPSMQLPPSSPLPSNPPCRTRKKIDERTNLDGHVTELFLLHSLLTHRVLREGYHLWTETCHSLGLTGLLHLLVVVLEYHYSCDLQCYSRYEEGFTAAASAPSMPASTEDVGKSRP